MATLLEKSRSCFCQSASTGRSGVAVELSGSLQLLHPRDRKQPRQAGRCCRHRRRPGQERFAWRDDTRPRLTGWIATSICCCLMARDFVGRSCTEQAQRDPPPSKITPFNWRNLSAGTTACATPKLKLEAKLATVKQEQTASGVDGSGQAKISNKTMRSLDDLAGSRDEDVVRVAEGIRQRLDKASAESEMLASSLDAQLDVLWTAREIDQQLMERKRRLGLAEG